jgi:hypothetical protein
MGGTLERMRQVRKCIGYYTVLSGKPKQNRALRVIICYLTTPSVARLYSVEWLDDVLVGKGFRRKCLMA